MSIVASSPNERELYVERWLGIVGQASFDSRAWSGLVQRLADEMAPGGCEIAFHPKGGRSPAIRLNALRAVSGSSHGLDPAPAGRGSGPAGALLTLGEEPSGVWRIELWSEARPAGSAGGKAVAEKAKRLLAGLGPLLVSAFQTSLALRAGLEPKTRALGDLWDPLPFGALLLEPSLRLVFANMAGEDLLRTIALFRPFGGDRFVRPARREDFAALAQACEMVLDGAGGRASFVLRGYQERGFGEVTVSAPNADPVGWPAPRAPGRAPTRLVVTLRPFEAGATIDPAPWAADALEAPAAGA